MCYTRLCFDHCPSHPMCVQQAYTSRKSPVPRGVSYTLNRSYARPWAWTFVTIYVSKKQELACEKYLWTQLGSPYNMKGYFGNFAAGCCCAYGVTSHKIQKSARTPAFCSQLIAAALIYSKISDSKSMEPATATPNSLFKWASSAPFAEIECHSKFYRHTYEKVPVKL